MCEQWICDVLVPLPRCSAMLASALAAEGVAPNGTSACDSKGALVPFVFRRVAIHARVLPLSHHPAGAAALKLLIGLFGCHLHKIYSGLLLQEKDLPTLPLYDALAVGIEDHGKSGGSGATRTAGAACHDSSAVALSACKGRKAERLKEHSVLCLEPRAKFSGCERVQCACAWLWYIV